MSDATIASSASTDMIERGEVLVRDAVPASLISMREIWKTYQMGSEEVHAFGGVPREGRCQSMAPCLLQ